jgi:hypothetical protein
VKNVEVWDMEELNFASDRVRELLMRLEGIQFFCAVAVAAGSVKGSSEDHKGETSKSADSVSGEASK